MPKILRKLRKMWRRYRALAVISLMLIVLLGALTLHQMNNKDELLVDHEEAMPVMAQQPIKLILETKYLCGTEIENKEFDSLLEAEEWILNEEHEWFLISKTENEFTFSREVFDDLSPKCKKEGYFGLSDDGILTLYKGPPTDNQVIQTFFRIDTQLLETKLPKEEVAFLKQGIRIRNVNEYLSVLSTFGEFAVEY